MQVGFRELTFWSFLMASAHGAGLMVLPIVLHAGFPERYAAAHNITWTWRPGRGVDRRCGDAGSYSGISERHAA